MEKEKFISMFINDDSLYFKKIIHDSESNSHYDLVKFGDLKDSELIDYFVFNNSIRRIVEIKIELDRIVVKFDKSSIILNIYLAKGNCIWEFVLIHSHPDTFLSIDSDSLCIGKYDQNEYNLEKLISIFYNMML